MPVKGFQLKLDVDAKVKIVSMITNLSQASIMNQAINNYCDDIIADNKSDIIQMLGLGNKKK